MRSVTYQDLSQADTDTLQRLLDTCVGDLVILPTGITFTPLGLRKDDMTDKEKVLDDISNKWWCPMFLHNAIMEVLIEKAESGVANKKRVNELLLEVNGLQKRLAAVLDQAPLQRFKAKEAARQECIEAINGIVQKEREQPMSTFQSAKDAAAFMLALGHE